MSAPSPQTNPANQAIDSPATADKMACFHCGEPIPAGIDIRFAINGKEQPFCCHGCRAVAEFISNQGQCDFYRYRGDSKPGEPALPDPRQWQQWDDFRTFDKVCKPLQTNDSSLAEAYTASIRIDGLYCSACGWLIDRQLREVPGVLDVRLNTITKQLQVDFDRDQVALSQILAVIDQLGYRPLLTNANAENLPEKERKASMKRLMVAGLGMMQVMMFAVALYGADFHGMDPTSRRFFGLISMLVATAVYFYAGSVFVKNALRDLKNRHLGMDVPVALSISLAYFFSVWHVLKGDTSGIYFDSMVMFVFFLLAGRHLEMGVRHKGMNAREALAAMVPVSVRRLLSTAVGAASAAETENVPLEDVRKGDVLLARRGDVIACDGEVLAGQAEVDESLLTGESRPVLKKSGDTVLAGSRVLQGELRIRSSALGNETFLGTLTDLLEQAQMQRPKSLQLVDRLAGWFVAAVLLLAALTAGWYALYNPAQLLPVVLAVLVATCPCALSLATPAALTAASVKLVKNGVLINSLDALSELPRCRSWVFDKTGTLTEFAMQISHWQGLADVPKEKACAIVAALQHDNHHPIATAFDACRNPQLNASAVQSFPGKGVAGQIDGQTWRAGKREWVEQIVPPARGQSSPVLPGTMPGTPVWLANDQQLVGVFYLGNRLRPDARDTIAALQASGHRCLIVSGDEPAMVQPVAETLGIKEWYGNLRPEQKINRVKALQASGEKVVMVGDGINDAPVLAQANVSFSFNQGAQLARSAADLVLMGGRLRGALLARATAQKTTRIIRQNIAWAIAYNLAITPLAVMGLLQPWMAAIGMSVSSILVVLNARRILGRSA